MGAISIYLFDRYLKKKEVKEHQQEVTKNDNFTDNPLKAVQETLHTTDINPNESSGLMEAVQDPNTTTSNSFYVPQPKTRTSFRWY